MVLSWSVLIRLTFFSEMHSLWSERSLQSRVASTEFLLWASELNVCVLGVGVRGWITACRVIAELGPPSLESVAGCHLPCSVSSLFSLMQMGKPRGGAWRWGGGRPGRGTRERGRSVRIFRTGIYIPFFPTSLSLWWHLTGEASVKSSKHSKRNIILFYWAGLFLLWNFSLSSYMELNLTFSPPNQ